MATYAFILGRKHLLSIAELCQVLPPKSTILDITHEAFIVEFPFTLEDAQATLNLLGGTIKIIEIQNELPKDLTQLPAAVSALCIANVEDPSKKFAYGISVYSFNHHTEKILKKILNHSKTSLKEANLKSRYINKNFTNPQNAALKGEKILEEGAELVVIQGRTQFFIGKTVALQDFEEYSRRDYQRPERDPRLGMLPPKLAQIMINLSGLHNLDQLAQLNPSPQSKTAKKPKKSLPASTVYDPFCGIGTVLSEAYVMGYSVIGSDIQSDIADKAQINLDWLRKDLSPTNQTVKIFPKDAELLTKQDLPGKVSAIVSETYLGPPMSHLPTDDQISNVFEKIEYTILNFLKALKKIIPAHTPLVISLLVYRDRKGYIAMDNLIRKIEQLGFKPQELIPQSVKTTFHLPSFRDQSLIYDREDQIVGRAIWKLQQL